MAACRARALWTGGAGRGAGAGAGAGGAAAGAGAAGAGGVGGAGAGAGAGAGGGTGAEKFLPSNRNFNKNRDIFCKVFRRRRVKFLHSNKFFSKI